VYGIPIVAVILEPTSTTVEVRRLSHPDLMVYFARGLSTGSNGAHSVCHR
jgi:hypothetical protein